MKRSLALGIIIIFLLGLTGCNLGTADDPQGYLSQSITTTGGADGGYPVTIIDSFGQKIIVDKKPEKVISLSPAITEILFAIDAEDLIVGVTEFCNYPEAALTKPRVGEFKDPNIELIVEAAPDLIFVAAGVQKDLVNKFESLNIEVMTLDAETVGQVLVNIQLAGMAVGKIEESSQLVEELKARVQAVKDRVAKKSYKPTVFFEIWDDPLMTAGPGSFVDDLINLAGGQNIAYDSLKSFAQFSFEILLERNPEIYLLSDHAHEPQEVMSRPGYQGLLAVEQGRVFSIQDDLVTLPGPRVVEGLEEMAKILHPDLF